MLHNADARAQHGIRVRTGGLEFGARTGAAGGEHLLGDVEIVTDALVESQSLPVVLTLNGQQWTSSSVEHTHGQPARVSAFSPTSGRCGARRT